MTEEEKKIMRRPGLAFGIAVWLCAASLHAEDAVPAHAQELLGAWKNTAKEEQIRFEPRRLCVHAEGLLNFFRLKYEGPGKFSYCVEGTWFTATWTSKDKTLTTVNGSDTNSYVRLAAVPPELELKPLAFGTSAPLAADRLPAIQKELAERLVKDQAVRTDPNRQGEMGAVDQDNTAYLKKLVMECGWIDVARFGETTSDAAFLIVQHSGDLPLMVAALPEIEKDLKAGRLRDGQDFALLYDRIMLNTGEKQRYGTQLTMAKGKLIVFPLESKEKVDQFRKEIGVFPLAQYLEIFQQQNGVKEVEFLED